MFWIGIDWSQCTFSYLKISLYVDDVFRVQELFLKVRDDPSHL